MKTLLVTLIAVGLFLLAGCSGGEASPKPGQVTKAEELVGLWVASEIYTQFNEDGTFRSGWTRDLDQPIAIGEYWFEDGRILMKEIEVYNVPSCGSRPGIYEIEQLENRNLKFTVIEDTCQARIEANEAEFKRVE